MTQGFGGFGRRQSAPSPWQQEPPSALEPVAVPEAPEAVDEVDTDGMSIEELKARFLAQEAKRKSNIAGGRDDLAFTIEGNDLQILHIDLEPGESIIAEPGAMVWKDFDIEVSAQLGDLREEEQRLISRMVSSGKRMLTGEAAHLAKFTHVGAGEKARIGLASDLPGQIIPVRVGEMDGGLICEQGGFLAAGQGVAIDMQFQRNLMTGLAGGEGFLLQKLTGDGMAFLHGGGHVIARTLLAGQRIHVDTGCLVAFEATVNYNVVATGGIRNTAFGGEGLFHAALTGPGRVWIQTLPFVRIAGEVASAVGGPDVDFNVGSVGGLIDRIL